MYGPLSDMVRFHYLSRYALVVLFVGAGVWHLVHPLTYLRIMPPWLPAHLLLVYVSGVFEIGLALLLLPPRTRRVAGYCLVALLVAVFPANLYMAQIHEQLQVPGWVAWGRLPLQAVLIWWVLAVGRQQRQLTL
jgi:uncharacterized membrane protein